MGGCYSCYRWTSKLFLLDPLDISQFAIFILHIAKCTVCNIHCALCILVAALCAFWPPGFHSQIPGESNTSVVEMQQQKFCKQQTSAVIHTSTSTSQVYKVLYSTRIVKHKSVFHWLSSFEVFRREIWVLSSDHSSQKSPNMENVRQKFIFLTLHKLQNVNIFGLLPKALTK